MKRPPETYGDNFPVAEGLSWNPRIPWRHAHVTPTAPPSWVRRLGWWTLVVLLMGLLLLLAAHDGFSEEAVPRAPVAGELIIRFHEGALDYPEGAARALLHQVAFRPQSLQRLNARYGLVVVERVMNPTRATRRMYRLVFASRAGLERALRAYRHDPYVISAQLAVASRPEAEDSLWFDTLPTSDV